MPHQCTTCGHTFPDGSKQMLSGCPDCGGNKFQFLPAGAVDDHADLEADTPAEADSTPDSRPESTADAEASRPSSRQTPADSGSTPSSSTSSSPASPSQSSDPAGSEAGTGPSRDESPPSPRADDPDSSIIDADAESDAREDSAQASARSTIVSRDELPPIEESAENADAEERPDLKQLREELNQQFESIKILEPGQYELNLMELYDREEYIIAIEEDGRYVIDVPSTDFEEQ